MRHTNMAANSACYASPQTKGETMAQRRFPTRIGVVLSVLFAPVLLADGGDPTLIHACVKKVNGQVRIVEPSETCLPSELSVHWPAAAPATASGSSIMVHGG